MELGSSAVSFGAGPSDSALTGLASSGSGPSQTKPSDIELPDKDENIEK